MDESTKLLLTFALGVGAAGVGGVIAALNGLVSDRRKAGVERANALRAAYADWLAAAAALRHHLRSMLEALRVPPGSPGEYAVLAAASDAVFAGVKDFDRAWYKALLLDGHAEREVLLSLLGALPRQWQQITHTITLGYRRLVAVQGELAGLRGLLGSVADGEAKILIVGQVEAIERAHEDTKAAHAAALGGAYDQIQVWVGDSEEAEKTFVELLRRTLAR